MEGKSISIIGLGQVGTAFLRSFSKAGISVSSAFNRTEIPEKFKKEFPQTKFIKGNPRKPEDIGDFIFLTIPDDSIPAYIKKLSSEYTTLSGKHFIHCSGTLSSEILAPSKKKGAHVASFHPIKAIKKTTTEFKDTWFDIEGDETVLEVLEELTQQLQANCFRVKPEAKPFLHAAAVVASNYLVVLSEMALRIAAEGDISEEKVLKALTPLMQNTLKNIEEFGPLNALTGPISRGDLQTVKEHIEILPHDLVSLYKILGAEAVSLSKRKQGERAVWEEIEKLLS